MKKLVIAEKPSVGKDIAKALGAKSFKQGHIEGKDYIITWALGHLITLQDPDGYNQIYKNWELNHLPIIPEKMKLKVIQQSKGQFNIIKDLIKQASQIIIATDAGREGELVARWILEYAKNKAPIKRLWISSVTTKAILEGFSNLKNGDDYINLYYCAYSRAVADWIVGINATRALTTKFNASLSCGRVQTPTLSIILKREEDIKNFKPKEFYKPLFNYKKIKFTHTGDRIYDKELATSLLNTLEKNNVTVKDIKSNIKKSHTTGYDLTALQQDANRLYGFSAKQTLDYTQRLYEQYKVLTYPRTDSKYITADIVDTLLDRLKAINFGEFTTVATKLLRSKPYTSVFVNNNKVTDHHAIIPTEESVNLSDLAAGEAKIYKLVIKKFLAMLSVPYEYEQTTISLKIGNETFTAKGKSVLNIGYKEIYDKDHDNEEDEEDEIQSLPQFKVGDLLEGEFQLHIGKTTPPVQFTEGTLLMAMENPSAFMDSKEDSLTKTLKETGGLGTVATRADIIEKLFSAALIESHDKYLHTTNKGRQLLELAPKDLRSPVLTAKWEQQLSKISKGELKKETFIKEIKGYTVEIIKEIRESQGTFKHTNITSHKCPSCEKLMLEIKGKKGKYLICQDRECGHRKNLELSTNARCPKCHKKLTLTQDKKKMFVCTCGHRENKESFDERKKRENNTLNKKDIKKYIEKINNEEPIKNNVFSKELQKLKF